MIAINTNYKIAPWATILYACDLHWWDWHHEEVKTFAGRKITQDEEAAKKYGLEHVKSVDKPGLSRDKSVIHQGRNSGVQAINLAVNLGAQRIVLLGFDMQTSGNKTHWHGHHPNFYDAQVSGWARYLEKLHDVYRLVAKDADEMGIEIVNATRETALRCFQRKPLSSLLQAQA